ncbi:YgfZ/GcvT domain-containing protein [Leptolyngbya sp. AN02str]|uniref:CAF17-like 4Fe-4S cluster assembly/insertion protein YgfZ n=1 Tax=Leptolyngbya sp. AN02str TaxID=3423363 RepID=UPI003D310D0A
MTQALQEAQAELGATFAERGAMQIPISFGNDEAARQAAQRGVAVYDASHWGRILVSDSDRLRFLHNQSTNAFEQRQPGEGCDTVFVTPTARTIDLTTAYILEDAVLLLVSPDKDKDLIKWMDRFIFFADKVKLENQTPTTTTFRLIGPESEALVNRLGIDPLKDQPYGTHQLVSLNGIEVRIAVGSGLAIAGYTLITQIEHAATVWKSLASLGAVPLGEQAWNQLRVIQGRPVPGQELTEDYNPLEAGLWSTISFQKGCYIGQETIARLQTYRGVKQQLWGIQLPTIVEPGSVITSGEDKIGKLTSCVAVSEGYVGLAYIRTKAIELAQTQVEVEGVAGSLVALPFVSHEYP